MKIHLCTIRNCHRPRIARGWCDAHYRRWRNHGHPLGGRRYRGTTQRFLTFGTGCGVTECTNPHSAKGYCAMHYERVKRHGDPLYVNSTGIDDVAIYRALGGDRPTRLTVAEREAIVRQLHRRGLRDRAIAEHLDIGTSGVWTIRQRLGLHANATPIGDFTGRVA